MLLLLESLLEVLTALRPEPKDTSIQKVQKVATLLVLMYVCSLLLSAGGQVYKFILQVDCQLSCFMFSPLSGFFSLST